MRDDDNRALIERALLVLAAAATALPAALGVGRDAGLLGALAAFLGRHGLAGAGLVLPLDWARDAGRWLLALRVGLQIAAALALHRFARAIGLARVAFAAALLLLLAPGFAGGEEGALVGATLALAAAERCVARRGAPALALALATAAALAPAPTVPPIVLLAATWGAVRLATGLHGRRLVGAVRLALGLGIGLLLAAPALFRVLGTAVERLLAPGFGPVVDLAGIDGALNGLLAGAAGRSHDLPAAFAPALPLLGPALLAPFRAGSAARPLRLVFAAAAVAAAASAPVLPLLRLPLAVGAAIALDDAARGAPATARARGLAALAAVLAAGGCVAGDADRIVVAAGVGGTLLALLALFRPFMAGVALAAGAVAVLVATTLP